MMAKVNRLWTLLELRDYVALTYHRSTSEWFIRTFPGSILVQRVEYRNFNVFGQKQDLPNMGKRLFSLSRLNCVFFVCIVYCLIFIYFISIPCNSWFLLLHFAAHTCVYRPDHLPERWRWAKHLSKRELVLWKLHCMYIYLVLLQLLWC